MGLVTIGVPEETAAELEELSKRLERTQPEIIALAVAELMARERSDLAEIEAALAEADAGEFASEEDVRALLAKYREPL
ncbi:ribbon-helix-helix protein, CopG family [Affinirhizobium pseudoryzae]|jgi:predicted transcriptional regulator|uniref:ribbon-helix-helix protein, CopG family n=1 Tax=Allorhizobium pseudoryzae TaxID=379684 RepID=UPI0013EAE182|nr:ribbon-helix-helix protein, CopG family [Allorhizobium pseudoryzae]